MSKLSEAREGRSVDGDGTETEENRQLANLLLANATRARPYETTAPGGRSSSKTSIMELLFVMMFVPVLWAWKLAAGFSDREDSYY